MAEIKSPFFENGQLWTDTALWIGTSIALPRRNLVASYYLAVKCDDVLGGVAVHESVIARCFHYFGAFAVVIPTIVATFLADSP